MQMEREMEMEEGKGVLLVSTLQRFLAIDMSKLTINHYGSSNFEILPLPVFKVFNLVEEGFPLGMRFFLRDSKLYFLGGEKPRAVKASPDFPVSSTRQEEGGHDKPFLNRSLFPFIYVSDLSDLITWLDDSSSSTKLELRKHSTSMLAAKAMPIVAEIEDKIYVLSGSPWHEDGHLPTPAFEVYDPSSSIIEQWKPLPEPPFHAARLRDCQEFDVLRHSIVGTTLYVQTWNYVDYCRCYYSYDVKEENWKFLGKSFDDVPVPFPLMPSFTGKFVPAYKDVFIYFEDNFLLAALIPSDDRIRIRYQGLKEVFGGVTIRNMLSSCGLVVDLGEHEMCVLKPGSIILPPGELQSHGENPPAANSGKVRYEDKEPPPLRKVLYMATFRVEKLQYSSSSAQARADPCEFSKTSQHYHDIHNESPFLTITCLSKGLYDLEAWGPEEPFLCSAFFHQWIEKIYQGTQKPSRKRRALWTNDARKEGIK